jgi:hypothetical protein
LFSLFLFQEDGREQGDGRERWGRNRKTGGYRKMGGQQRDFMYVEEEKEGGEGI